MKQQGERPVYLQPENWVEFSCYDCRRELRQHGQDVKRVLHRYDFSGTLIETLTVE
jgi:hypothetical protein